MKTSSKIGDSDKNTIVKMYKNGCSMNKIADHFSVTIGTIRYHLIKNGVKRRSISESTRKDKINHHAFANANNNEVLYWAGFLMADGCLGFKKEVNSYFVTLCSSKKDLNQIEKFKKFLGSTSKIVSYPNGYSLKITSKQIFDDLHLFGLTPRKTFSAKATKICYNSRDFWRGVVDGDGCLCIASNKQMIFSVVGSYNLMQQFSEFVRSYADIDLKVRKEGNIYRCQTSKRIYVKKLLILLYKDANVFLRRKMKKCLQILSLIERFSNEVSGHSEVREREVRLA